MCFWISGPSLYGFSGGSGNAWSSSARRSASAGPRASSQAS